MYRFLCLATALLFILISPLSAEQQNPTGQIRIGIFPLEPINYIDGNGAARGFHPTLLRKIATQEDWTPLFVPVTWAEGLEGLQSGKIDLLVSVAYTPERATVMDYSYEPALEIWGQLFVRPDGKNKKMADLEGQTVAIMLNGINGRNFQKMAAQLGVNCNYEVFANLTDVMAAVQTGKAAAGVAPQHFGLRHAKTYGLVPSSIQFSPFPIYYATKKGQQRLLLSQIDSYLTRWKGDQDSFYYQQLNYWLTGKQLQREIIPRWLLLSLTAAAATALILLGLSLLFNTQVRRRTAELVAANQNISHSEKRYRTLVESMIQPMALHEIITDDSGNPVDFRFLDVNPAFAQMLGMSATEIIGKRGLEIRPETDPGLIKSFARVAANGTSDHFESNDFFTGKHLDIVAYSPAPGRFVAIATDITERVKMREEQQRLQDQLLHAQKLESLGVLAGGIAHDFNNILMAVLGHCELALRRLANESPARQNIEQIKTSANRAADLANQMLAYSGKGKFVVEPLDLSRIIDEMQQMLNVSISKKAILRYEFTPNMPSIEADATQIRQVILNLVINASDAIGDRSGVIAITTGVIDCDLAYLQDTWLDEKRPAGQYVYLEVADTGCGMDRETVNRIFEPFFSTKFTGRGLGMAAVLGIVRGHKGAIKVYSEINKGSTFKILLPAASKPVALFDIDQDSAPLRGTGTIMLVDDDETVRSIGREMLEEFGFEVITADDGRDALEKFKTSHPEIKLVLMDLTMPHMDGKQAYSEMRRVDPNVKVVMSSGYNEQEVSQKFAGKGVCGFLKKPYLLSDLQKTIQNCLKE